MKSRFAAAGSDEIIEHLAWEVGAAAEGLVDPIAWLEHGLLVCGVCDDPLEAARMVERLARDNSDIVIKSDEPMEFVFTADMDCHSDPEPIGDANALHAAICDMRRAFDQDIARNAAIAAMERDMGEMCLIIHARLESCSLSEVDQAAQTMISIALEHDVRGLLDETVASLLVFSSTGDPWQDDDGDDDDRDPDDPEPDCGPDAPTDILMPA